MSQPATLSKRTYVYKEFGTKVELDIYRPASPDGPLPVVVWIHGGALIMGSRANVPPHLLALCRERGYALVSLDYRLAPQVQATEIVGDIKDAFRWLRGEGAAAAGLDANRLAVVGASAGGYLTLMTGMAVEPKPLALVAYYGYGDVDGDWYTQPSEHYRTVVPLYGWSEAFEAIRDDVVTSPPNEAQAVARRRYYHYLRQNGLWTREVTGFDPVPGRARLDALCPVRNVTPEYPPTLLIHGTADTDVPYELSVNMAAALKEHGVAHELVTVEGAEHGLADVEPSLVEAAHARAAAFLVEYLG